MVPSYSGTPCLVARLTGFFQSLVPDASPTKFSTPTGALSGKSVHVILPAVVSMIAVGFEAGTAGLAAVAGFAGVLGLAGAAWLPEPVCANAADPRIKIITIDTLPMNTPFASGKSYYSEVQRCIVRQGRRRFFHRNRWDRPDYCFAATPCMFISRLTR